MPNNSAYLSDKEVLFTGWMVKAPPEHKMKRKTGLAKVITYMNCTSPRFSSEDPCRSFHTRWHRRYFVLFKPKGGLPNEYLLEYFTDETCTRKKGVVDLDNCSEIAAFDQTLQDIKMEYVLSLKTMNRNKHRVYFMSCENEETMNEWVSNLIFACNLVARNDDDYQMNDVPECPMNVADSSFSTLSSRNHSCSSLPQTPATRSHRSNTTSVSSGALLGTPSNGGLPLPPPPERPHPNSYDSDGSFARTQSSVYNTPLDRNVYNVPPNNEIDGPPVGNRGEEHYYNMRPHDSVYQMPPEHPRGASAPLSHEYINLANVNKDEDDVYKIPTNPDSVPPPVPPPPLPKRSLRASFVRRGSNRRPNVQQPAQQPAPQPAAQQPVSLPQPRTTQHHYMQLPPQPPAQLKMAAPPPPASPGSEQHEYLNLWPSGDPSSDSGSGFGGGGGSSSGHMGYSSENAPRNINDVPPLLPARPQRLRQQRDAGKHTSSCSNSSSSSSTSTNSSASPPCMGSGVSPPYDYGSERRPSAPSPSNRVSYMSANDLIFSSEGVSSTLRRSSSFTEYNELDPVRTCAVAKVAEGLKKNTN